MGQFVCDEVAASKYDLLVPPVSRVEEDQFFAGNNSDSYSNIMAGRSNLEGA